MKINFLGDSITAGVGTVRHEQMFTDIVCKHFGAEECNFGVSGTRIAKQKKPSENPLTDQTFIERAYKMPKDADFTFVFGGVNDFGHGDAPIGDLTDETDFTFCGAFRNLVGYLKNVYGNKLCFILPLPKYDQGNPFGEWGRKKKAGAILSEYVFNEKMILEEIGVDYIDLTDNFTVPESCNGNEWTADGTHPNSFGNKIIATAVIEYLEEKFF